MNPKLKTTLLILAAFCGAVGVITGAFGAHALKARLPAESLEVLKTGVFYLFIHVCATLLTVLLATHPGHSRWLSLAGISFLTGIFFFSGSLFVISTSSLTGIHIGPLGLITPLGGLAFIFGWLSLAIGAWKRPFSHGMD